MNLAGALRRRRERTFAWLALAQARGASMAQSLRSNLHPGRTKNGGASRDRTDDLKLAKLALSQLSYGPMSMLPKPSGLRRRIAHRALLDQNGRFRGSARWIIWWAREDLNLRPHAYQACALTN